MISVGQALSWKRRSHPMGGNTEGESEKGSIGLGSLSQRAEVIRVGLRVTLGAGNLRGIHKEKSTGGTLEVDRQRPWKIELTRGKRLTHKNRSIGRQQRRTLHEVWKGLEESRKRKMIQRKP